MAAAGKFSLQEWASGAKAVLSDKKYLALLIALSAAFCVAYIFGWNMILFRNLFVREDLWTVPNILLLLAISVLSGLAATLTAFSLKANITYHKNRYGFLSLIPAFFASACPTCAPLILSFTSASFAIGMSLAKYNVEIRIASALLLSATILYLSKSIGTCKVSPKR